MKLNPSKLKKPITLVIAIAVILALAICSFAFFSDRANSGYSLSTATFAKDGYSLSRTVKLVPYLAGEDISVTVIEDNDKDEPVQSEITMSVDWASPDTGSSPFGNPNSADNATITVDGTAVSYTYDKNTGKITFKLPTHKMEASTTGNQRVVTFHIPESLKATGTLSFTFDKVKLAQSTKLDGTGFYVEFNNAELNQKEALDFDADVVWDFSETLGTKKIIGYLTGSNGNYGLTVKGSGIMHDWSSGTASSQSNYKGSISSLSLSEGITTIGDYAFSDFSKITSLTLPQSTTSVGKHAFDGISIKSLTIPANVTELGAMAFGNCDELTKITFNQGASTTIKFPAAGSGTGAFYVGTPYSKTNPLRTEIITGNKNVLNYDWTSDNRGYVITVKEGSHGDLTVKPTVAINGKTITLTPAADTGYTYNGAVVTYKDASGNEKTMTLDKSTLSFEMPASDVTITSKWPANTYTVKYNANGGSGTMADSTLTYDKEQALRPNTFTKPGYSFAGWATTASGNVVYGDGATVENLTSTNGATINLYAKWDVIVYDITYVPNGGTLPDDADKDYTVEDPATLPTPTRPGYDFEGWYEDEKLTVGPVTKTPTDEPGDKTYYAKWDPITYTISYTLNGGTVATANPTTYTVETATFKLNNPTKTGYIFTGWTGSNGTTAQTSVSIEKGSMGNKTFTANWTPITYKVKYNANTGTGTMADSTHTYDKSQTLTPNAFSKPGYSFAGWATTASGNVVYGDGATVENLTSTNGATINLYAKWDVIVYDITYVPNGGTLPADADKDYTVEDPATLPTPTRPGYDFEGWYEDEKLTDGPVTETPTDEPGDKTYYAKWDPITYTISYTLNGGKVATANPTTYNIETATFKLNNPTKTGYIFTGWTGSNGTTAQTSVSIEKGSMGNKAFTANWTPITYKVKYNANTGTGTMADSTLTYDKEQALRPNTFTKPGYSFAGWATTASGNVVYGDGATVENLTSTNGATINLYAKWNIIVYDITYVPNGGTLPDDADKDYTVEDPATLPIPTRPGYDFEGWYEDEKLTDGPVTKTPTDEPGDKTYYAKWDPITYTISYNLNGGKVATANPTTYNIETATFKLNNPTKTGYTFKGWTGSNGTTAQTSVSVTKGSTGNKTFTANWTANTDTAYTVNHWQQNVNGGDTHNSTNFTLKDTDNLTGTTGAKVTPVRKTYEGFTAPAGQEVTIAADGSTVVNYYYTRNSYTVTLNKGTGISDVSGAGTYKYGADVTINATVSVGYTWNKWTGTKSTATQKYTFKMPAGNVTNTANANASTGTAYTVNHWLQNVTGGTTQNDTNFTLKDTDNLTGTTGASVTPAVNSYTGFTAPSTQTVKIAADGSTVVNYYYTRNSYTVTLNKGTGISEVTGAGTYKYGAEVTINATVSTGYKWSKWTGTHNTATQKYSFTMPANAVTDTAYAAPRTDTPYKVQHWQQNVNGGDTHNSINFTLKDTDDLTGTTGAKVTPARKTYEGFTAPAGQEVTIAADGSTVVNYYYTRNSYTVTLNKGTGISDVTGAGTYKYGAEVTINATVSTGYKWNKWTGTHSTATQKYTFTMPAGNVTDTANAVPSTGTPYKVQHWQQNINGGDTHNSTNFTLKDTDDLTGTTGAKVTPARKSYEGFTAPAGQEVTIAADGSTVVNYYYTRNSYKLTLNKGTGISDVSGAGTYKYGAEVTINATVSTGYKWSKWTGTHSTATQKYTFKMPANAVTDTANATPITYEVKYNANGGSGTMANSSHTYDAEKALTSNAFTKTGYTFAGWATTSTGSVAYTNGQSVKNLSSTDGDTVNLYAKWTPITYKVKYNANGGSGTMADSTHTYDTAKALSSNVFIKDGYEFIGWATSASGDVVYTDGQSVKNLSSTKNATVNLYAKWRVSAIPVLAPNYSWFTNDYIDSFDVTKITLVDSHTATTGLTGSWNAAVDKANDGELDDEVICYLYGTELIVAGNGYGKIFANPDSYGAFWNFIQATNIDGLSLLDTRNVTNMEYMFNAAGKVTELDVGHFDTTNVTSMRSMFSGCSTVTTLDVKTKLMNAGTANEYIAWDTGNVENMWCMFEICAGLTSLDVRNWDTQNVEIMYSTFFNCSSLKTLDLSTQKVTIGNRSYDSWDTGKVTYIEGFVKKCYELEYVNVSTFDTSSVENGRLMFSYSSKLDNIDVSDKPITLNGRNVTTWDMSNNTDMYGMFLETGITSIDVTSWNTSKVEDFQDMFESTKLTTLDISSFDTSGVTSDYKLSGFASNCPSLTMIILGDNFGQEGYTGSAGVIGGMFYANGYTSTDPLRTKVVNPNEAMLEYDWENDCRGFTIFVNTATGGDLTADRQTAINGQTVTLTPAADTGYSYNGATIIYTDENGTDKTITLDANTKTFTMPVGDVEIVPKWNTNAPVVKITSPTATSSDDPSVTYNGTYEITGTATDADGDLKTLMVNGKEVAVASDGSWSLDLSTTATEAYTISAVATDKAGHTSSDTKYLKCNFKPFVITDDNRALVGYTGKAKEKLVIPEYFLSQEDDSDYGAEIDTWYRVVGIAPWGFKDCDGLVSVNLPNSILSIGYLAFDSCTSLTTINIPNQLTAIPDSCFGGCYNLTEITIPDSVTSIGDFAFWATSLETVVLPDSLTSIGEYAFGNNDSLETAVSIPASVTSIGYAPFFACRNLPKIEVDANNVNYCSIDGVLYTKDMSTLVQYPTGSTRTSYTVLDGVTIIGEGSLSYCAIDDSYNDDPTLTNVILPESVTTIEKDAFYGNAGIKSVTIPDNVTYVGAEAFCGCTALRTVSIPASLTSIDSSAFSSCLVKNFIVDDSNPAYCSVDGVMFSKDMTTLVKYPGAQSAKTYTIPDSVTTIGAYAFDGVNYLTKLIIPDSVTSVGEYSLAYTIVDAGSIEKIYFTGSEDQWNAITFGDDWDLDTDLTITYNYVATASLSLTPALELPEGITAGEAQIINAMPDVVLLNEEAAANAPENTILYGWLVDSGMAQQIVLPEDLEAALDSVYSEEPEWEMTITPLYQAVEEMESTEPTDPTETSEPAEETEATEPSESDEPEEPTEAMDSSETTSEGDGLAAPEDGSSEEAAATEPQTSEPKLPEGVAEGEAQTISAMPDVVQLNDQAAADVSENTVLYGWLVDNGISQEIVLTKDLEATLNSLYSENPELEITLTVLYQAIEEDSVATAETEASAPMEPTEATEPVAETEATALYEEDSSEEAAAATEASEPTDPTEPKATEETEPDASEAPAE